MSHSISADDKVIYSDSDYADFDRKSYFKISKSAHCAYRLHYHFVSGTKRRKKFFTLSKEFNHKIVKLAVEACRRYDIHLLTLAIGPNHVHCIFSLKPTQAPSEMVNKFKGFTGNKMFRAFPELKDRFKVDNFWASGYYIESLGDKNAAQIKSYLDKQKEHHLMTFDKSKG